MGKSNDFRRFAEESDEQLARKGRKNPYRRKNWRDLADEEEERRDEKQGLYCEHEDTSN